MKRFSDLTEREDLALAISNDLRTRYTDTPILTAALQVVVGGVLVFIAAILIGSQ